MKKLIDNFTLEGTCIGDGVGGFTVDRGKPSSVFHSGKEIRNDGKSNQCGKGNRFMR